MSVRKDIYNLVCDDLKAPRIVRFMVSLSRRIYEYGGGSEGDKYCAIQSMKSTLESIFSYPMDFCVWTISI